VTRSTAPSYFDEVDLIADPADPKNLFGLVSGRTVPAPARRPGLPLVHQSSFGDESGVIASLVTI